MITEKLNNKNAFIHFSARRKQISMDRALNEITYSTGFVFIDS